MDYEVTLLAAAARDLRKLPVDFRSRIIRALNSLKEPRQPGTKNFREATTAGDCVLVIIELSTASLTTNKKSSSCASPTGVMFIAPHRPFNKNLRFIFRDKRSCNSNCLRRRFQPHRHMLRLHRLLDNAHQFGRQLRLEVSAL